MGSEMTKLKARLLCSILVLFVAPGGQAQQGLLAPNSNSTDAFHACEAAGDEEYTLGRGDSISVEVIEYPALSGKHVVGPDGMITVGIAGSIKVADLTREQAAAAIRTKLLNYYTSPTVVVGVDVYSSDYLLVMGAVEHPGPMMFDKPPTLLSVISRAGIQTAQSSSAIQSKPIGIPERVALFCRNHTIVWESFKKLLEGGDPAILKPLNRDVVIYVPSPNERYVSVIGEVVHPGVVQLQDGSNLIEMLTEAGGILTDKSGRLPKIQIIHKYNQSVETVPYEDILLSKNIDLALQTGDIIYVPESKFSRVAVTFEKISPLLSIATIATLIDHP
jgi:polysaccharide biosynthesis/export protein